MIGSPPTRRRGLKPKSDETPLRAALVASHAEAWIETRAYPGGTGPGSNLQQSHPARGLKLVHIPAEQVLDCVASHAEAWIETRAAHSRRLPVVRRLPRGGVD